jgi:hypothetical protein
MPVSVSTHRHSLYFALLNNIVVNNSSSNVVTPNYSPAHNPHIYSIVIPLAVCASENPTSNLHRETSTPKRIYAHLPREVPATMDTAHKDPSTPFTSAALPHNSGQVTR